MTETTDRAVRQIVYQSFVDKSNAPTLEAISSRLGIRVSDTEASLRRLAADHVLVLEPDQVQIRMAMPFSAVSTPFRVTAGVRSWYANCAWDALGIPAALHLNAEIDTTCADCGETTRLEIIGEYLGTDDGVIHFAIPAAHWWDNIVFT